MPIIISEIEINIEVVPNETSGSGSSSTPADMASLQEAIVKECIEKVMEIINLKNER